MTKTFADAPLTFVYRLLLNHSTELDLSNVEPIPNFLVFVNENYQSSYNNLSFDYDL